MEIQTANTINKKDSKRTKFYRILLYIFAPSLMFYLEESSKPENIKKRQIQKQKKINKERELIRNFKVEITSSFWGTKQKLIQRDKPLTDEEIDLILNVKK